MIASTGLGVLLLNLTGGAAAHGSLQVPIWVGSLVLVCLVFLALGVNAVVQGILRTRTRSASVARENAHILSVPGLGTTLADGGDAQDERTDAEI